MLLDSIAELELKHICYNGFNAYSDRTCLYSYILRLDVYSMHVKYKLLL